MGIIATYKPSQTCTSGGLKPRLKYKHMKYVMIFLVGVNDFYTAICDLILLIDPISPLNKVFFLVAQEEKQRELGVSSSSFDQNVAFAVKFNDNKGKMQMNDHPFCDHCNIHGHTREMCFNIHGYPAHFKKKSY
jgi:hypothetical protein